MTIESPNATMIDTLVSLAETVRFLAEHKAVRPNDIAQGRLRLLKQLEILGLVCRSGSGGYIVQRERLRKLLKRIFVGCSESEKRPCLSAYARS